ncbi:EEF1A lysine methyltransferase 1 isoform X1 [Folsomia candida]|uniref:EEF1A lysine methyltransferase 1 isoform X1 n=1 Tax=Folsomia candida TaxID=158441 RepID=UPI000B8F168B|nr:EEF1A lysine methyltransferase 1 isoform X1 [Folsomia candida]
MSTTDANEQLSTPKKPNTDVLDDEDDDVPQLSAHALAALHDFYDDQRVIQEALEEAKKNGNDNSVLFKTDLGKFFPEDWQLSQFWYEETTSRKLAEEVLAQAGPNGRVACVSCPSIFRACQVSENVVGRTVDLFEFDKRFDAFGSYFIFYDYKDPENVPEECLQAYKVVIVDPPFLSEECLEKVAITVKKIVAANGKIILCSGNVMEAKAFETMGLKPCAFVPIHKKTCLKNPFACFTNYDCQLNNNAS